MNLALKLGIDAMEKGFLPDSVVRLGIRKLCKDRLGEYLKWTPAEFGIYHERYIKMLEESPIAIHEADANEQHYELPQEFFGYILGPHLKYSSCYFGTDSMSLGQAEVAALEITCERAQLKNGEQILELGCGWGSLSLFMAEHYKDSKIVSLSNSASQREYIESEAAKRGIKNLIVITGNVAQITDLDSIYGKFDRVVSVEMFEHLKNYGLILSRISSWLKPTGTLFVHIFTHATYPYPFENEGEENWMGKYFFTGGQMPSHDLLSRFQRNMFLEKSWKWNGEHYSKTSEFWLRNMDRNRTKIMKVLESNYGKVEAGLWFNRWRVFFMSCAELFGFASGTQWGISHYLFKNKLEEHI